MNYIVECNICGWTIDAYQKWPSRAALLKTIELQGRSAPHPTHWRDWLTSPYNRAKEST